MFQKHPEQLADLENWVLKTLKKLSSDDYQDTVKTVSAQELWS